MSPPRVWVDLDNVPHAPFFRPILTALREKGCPVLLTARGDGHTPEVAARLGLDAEVVGGWRGTGMAAKVVATAARAWKLARLPGVDGVDVAVSHGSRPMLLAAAARRIPAITMYDYEGVSAGLFHRLSSVLVVPEVLPESSLPTRGRARVVRYPGLKEEVYLADFRPDPRTRSMLGVEPADVLVVLRPESETAHYRAEPNSTILQAVLDRLAETDAVRVVLLPRSVEQGRRVRAALGAKGVHVIVPEPLDGRDLVWAADLVISGGGTMTREAAVLGVPAYSIFRRPVGAVDQHLAERGRLVLVRSPEDVQRIRIERRSDPGVPPTPSGRNLPQLLAEEICSAAASRHP